MELNATDASVSSAPRLGEMQIGRPLDAVSAVQASADAFVCNNIAPNTGGIHTQAAMHDEPANPPDAPPALYTAVYPDVYDKGPSPRSTVPPGRSTSTSSDEDADKPDPSASSPISEVGPVEAEQVAQQDNVAAATAAAAKSDPSLAPCLIHFDSGKHFKLHRSGIIFKHIRKYLVACYESTRSEEFPQCSICAKTLPGIAPPVPQQNNAKDCGVYTLEMIERVLCSPPKINATFIKKKGVVGGSPFNNKWFRSDVIDQKRSDMLHLIADLESRMYEPVLV